MHKVPEKNKWKRKIFKYTIEVNFSIKENNIFSHRKQKNRYRAFNPKIYPNY